MKKTYSNQEIYNALSLIRDVCNEYSDCKTCPFGKRNCCQLNEETPQNWRLIPPDEYKAFN